MTKACAQSCCSLEEIIGRPDLPQGAVPIVVGDTVRGVWYQGDLLQLALGAKGDPGSQILTGAGAPSGALGAIGDLYIDSVSPNTYYIKTGPSTWTSQGTLQGDEGPGVATGGTLGQVLIKTGAPDFSTGWSGISGIATPAIGTLPGVNLQQTLQQAELGFRDWGMPIATNVAEFDGANDVLTANFASAALPTEFSFGCWCKLRRATGFRYLFTTNYSGVGADQIALWAQLGTGGGRFGVGRFSAAGAFLDNWAGNVESGTGQALWVHVLVRVRRNLAPTLLVDVWVNGQLYGFANTSAITIPTNYGATIGIGALGPGGATFFDGYMSNATLHSRLLTRDEILSLARRGREFIVPTSGLIAWWPMDASLTTDASGNGNTLTAVGGMALIPMN